MGQGRVSCKLGARGRRCPVLIFVAAVEIGWPGRDDAEQCETYNDKN